MKRSATLLVVALVAILAPATAEAGFPWSDAPAVVTCNEFPWVPADDPPGDPNYSIRGGGSITCSQVVSKITIYTRLIRNGTLLAVSGPVTCYSNDYCQHPVYSNQAGGDDCWKSRVWGFFGNGNPGTPTGASTSAQWCE